MKNKNRPLSPHISIYKWQIGSMVTSIGHRATGILSYGGILLFAWIIIINIYAGYEKNYFACLFKYKIMKILFNLWIFSLYYHFTTGIRHLFWDMNYGFDIKIANKTAIVALIAAIILTIITLLAI